MRVGRDVADAVQRWAIGRSAGNGAWRSFAATSAADSLAVRNRRPGDRFRPVGLDGRKKLQDFFVDRKVAAATRDAVPLVVDETDRIVWVAGLRNRRGVSGNGPRASRANLET